MGFCWFITRLPMVYGCVWQRYIYIIIYILINIYIYIVTGVCKWFTNRGHHLGFDGHVSLKNSPNPAVKLEDSDRNWSGNESQLVQKLVCWKNLHTCKIHLYMPLTYKCTSTQYYARLIYGYHPHEHAPLVGRTRRATRGVLERCELLQGSFHRWALVDLPVKNGDFP